MAQMNLRYYFGTNYGAGYVAELRACKVWQTTDEAGNIKEHLDTLLLGTYSSIREAMVLQQHLTDLMNEQGLEAAMNLAEGIAASNKLLDRQRDDYRIFFQDGAPPDPFTTRRFHKIYNAQYEVSAYQVDDQTDIVVYKMWGDSPDQYESIVIPQPGSDWDEVEAQAEVWNTFIMNQMFESAMHAIELEAVEAGVLDPNRVDGRIFFNDDAPPDLFKTIRQAELEDNDND